MMISLSPVALFIRLQKAFNARRDLGLDVAFLALERIIRLAVGVLVSSLMARHLGVEGFGELSLGMALGSIGLSIAALGLDAVLVSDIARTPRKSARLLITAGIMRGVAALVVWLCVAGWAFWSVPNPGAIIVLSLAIFGVTTGVSALWFQAVGRARTIALVQIVFFLIASVGRLALVAIGASLMAFAWLLVAEIVLSGALLSWIWAKNVKSADWWLAGRLGPRLISRLFRRGLPWWGSAICVMAFTRLDQVLLHELGGAAELGVLAAAARLSEQAHLLPMALAVPMLGRLASSLNEEERLRRVRRYLAASAVAGYACATALWFLGPILLRWLFGNDFGMAGEVLRIQALAIPFLFLAVARAQIMAATGGGGGVLIGAVVGALTGCALNFALIPELGARGSAWAGLAAQVVASFISAYFLSDWRWLVRLQVRALVAPWLLWRD